MKSDRQISFQERHLLTPDEILAETLVMEILRSTTALSAHLEELFKAYGLTSPQYSTLGVLREAGSGGLPCQSLSASLLTRDPDATRLADRLEEHNLLVKKRGEHDRRVVQLTITEQGPTLLAALDEPVARLHVEATATLSGAEKAQLVGLIGKLRGQENRMPLCRPDVDGGRLNRPLLR